MDENTENMTNVLTHRIVTDGFQETIKGMREIAKHEEIFTERLNGIEEIDPEHVKVGMRRLLKDVFLERRCRVIIDYNPAAAKTSIKTFMYHGEEYSPEEVQEIIRQSTFCSPT